jgi:hypothetical protein
LFGYVGRDFTAKDIKAEAPYAISKYGKEYDTSATRLLFERNLRRHERLVGTVTDKFKTKI